MLHDHHTKRTVSKKGPTQSLHAVVKDSETYETTEYDVFKLDKQNRPIDEERVAAFVKKFSKGEFFLKDMPGLIGEDFDVVDGQHRLIACEKLGLPFFYRISKDVQMKDVVSIQTNAGWSTADYLAKYVTAGNQDYVVLHRFVERYNFSISTAILLLSDSSTKYSLKKSGFNEGRFEVHNETAGHDVAQKIIETRDAGVNFWKDRAFAMAMIKIAANDKYDHEKMIEKIRLFPSLFVRQTTVDDYMRKLEEAYNYHVAQKHRLRLF